MATRVTLICLTRYGVSFRVIFYVPASVVSPTDARIVAIVNAINAACACVGISVEITQGGTFTDTAGTGATICEDKAVLVVPDATGEKHLFKLPAPKLGTGTIFDVDNTTVLLSNTSVAALSTNLVTYGKGKSGDALTALKKGHRWGGKRLNY